MMLGFFLITLYFLRFSFLPFVFLTLLRFPCNALVFTSWLRIGFPFAFLLLGLHSAMVLDFDFGKLLFLPRFDGELGFHFSVGVFCFRAKEFRAAIGRHAGGALGDKDFCR